MARRTLYNKVWDLHKVATLPNGQDQIFVGLHLIHEVTTPQAFAAIRESGGTVAYPQRTVATLDHIIPTDRQGRPFLDVQAEAMVSALENNIRSYGIRFFNTDSDRQGIVHVIGPELGLTQPGMTIACGDSHTSTHGAFGSLAFGIGTSEVRYVLETQTLPLNPMRVRRILVNGQLGHGVYAKDVILKIINRCGVKGGMGFAYEYAGDTIHRMSMEERMTICNMSIEGGARMGYINPDAITVDYLKGREFSPKGAAFEHAKMYWQSVASDADAEYDDTVRLNAADIAPMVTWGVNPGQSVGVTESLPMPGSMSDGERKGAEEAYGYMKLRPGQSIRGFKINVAFIGSCTNSRISDLREAAKILDGRKVAANVLTLVVPGSQQVKKQAEAE
ncbi:MAG: 3-isopropylmalate dehydratase large subunit, partial [Candidatus Margulisiibacteriota bacterium]